MTTHKQEHTHTHIHLHEHLQRQTTTNNNTQSCCHCELGKLFALFTPCKWDLRPHQYTSQKRNTTTSLSSVPPPPLPLALTFSLLITLFTHFEYKIVMCWFALTDACPAYKKSRLVFFFYFHFIPEPPYEMRALRGLQSMSTTQTQTNKQGHGDTHTLTHWESHCHKRQTFKGASTRNHKSVAYLRARL